MSAVASIRSSAAPRPSVAPAGWLAFGGITAVAAGASLTLVPATWVLGAALASGAFVLGVARWRWSIYGLVAYLPFSGIAIIASYPRTQGALLAKDVLFVLPAYVGFGAYAVRHRPAKLLGDAPVALLAVLAVLVLGQALNPALPNPLVGLIGAKVWLLYVPLYFLGYHFVRDRTDLFRLLGLMSALALVPALVGIAEAVLIYTGRAQQVYALYGNAASAVTQDFATIGYAHGGTIRRVPSLFSFVAQYYVFVSAMVAISYAWWRGALAGTPRRVIGAITWATMIAAAFLSGARGAFLFIPLLVILLLALERPRSFALARGSAPIVVLLAAAALLGARWSDVLAQSVQRAHEELSGFVTASGFAIKHTWLGAGTGVDTNASRYAYSSANAFTGVSGRWYESWWVKSAIELGIAGLAVAILLVGTLVVRSYRLHVTLRDPRLRAVSAAILAFLIWNAIYAIKAQYLDIDPDNVYFWLLAGVLARVPALDRSALPEPAAP